MCSELKISPPSPLTRSVGWNKLLSSKRNNVKKHHTSNSNNQVGGLKYLYSTFFPCHCVKFNSESYMSIFNNFNTNINISPTYRTWLQVQHDPYFHTIEKKYYVDSYPMKMNPLVEGSSVKKIISVDVERRHIVQFHPEVIEDCFKYTEYYNVDNTHVYSQIHCDNKNTIVSMQDYSNLLHTIKKD